MRPCGHCIPVPQDTPYVGPPHPDPEENISRLHLCHGVWLETSHPLLSLIGGGGISVVFVTWQIMCSVFWVYLLGVHVSRQGYIRVAPATWGSSAGDLAPSFCLWGVLWFSVVVVPWPWPFLRSAVWTNCGGSSASP